MNSRAQAGELITWNVGQGQWVTWEHDDICEHFDIGGEFAPWKLISLHCGSKENRAHFSHWDWDHIGLSLKAARRLKHFCVVDFPRGEAPSHGKEEILSLTPCPARIEPTVKQLFWHDNSPVRDLTSNDLSRVFTVGNALIQGDSTKREELQWVDAVRDTRVQVLILGHHGSRTSTSTELLHRLPHLQMAIATARAARYGHPHREVVERLRQQNVPTLRTEEWGSIRIEFPKKSPDKVRALSINHEKLEY